MKKYYFKNMKNFIAITETNVIECLDGLETEMSIDDVTSKLNSYSGLYLEIENEHSRTEGIYTLYNITDGVRDIELVLEGTVGLNSSLIDYIKEIVNYNNVTTTETFTHIISLDKGVVDTMPSSAHNPDTNLPSSSLIFTYIILHDMIMGKVTSFKNLSNVNGLNIRECFSRTTFEHGLKTLPVVLNGVIILPGKSLLKRLEKDMGYAEVCEYLMQHNSYRLATSEELSHGGIDALTWLSGDVEELPSRVKLAPTTFGKTNILIKLPIYLIKVLTTIRTTTNYILESEDSIDTLGLNTRWNREEVISLADKYKRSSEHLDFIPDIIKLADIMNDGDYVCVEGSRV